MPSNKSKKKKSKEERDKARIKRAATRTDVRFSTLAANPEDLVVAMAMANPFDCEELRSDDEPGWVQRNLALLSEYWEPKWTQQCAEFDDLDQRGTGTDPRKVVELTTALIDEIKEVLANLNLRLKSERIGERDIMVKGGKDKYVCMYVFEYEAYLSRAVNRKRLGNIEGAYQDATVALSLTQTHKASKGKPYSYCEEIDLLILRGQCFREMKELDKARDDLRAAAAGVRCSVIRNGAPWEEKQAQVAPELLSVLTLKKIQEHKTRPYFSPEERLKWQKELGFGLYHTSVYTCLGCGARPDSTIELKMCGRCKASWFCSRECQVKAWKSGHRKECDPNKVVVHQIMKCEKPVVLDDIASKGHFLLKSSKTPCVFVRDPLTGQLFDSFSDSLLSFDEMEQILSSLASPFFKLILNGNCTGTVTDDEQVQAMAQSSGAQSGQLFQCEIVIGK